MELVKNIFFNTDKIVGDTDVKVTYAGKLFQNGADNVTIHCGYGENWEKSQDIPMQKTELGFQANVYVQPESKLNFCFKDSAGIWDNNNGTNYSFKIEPGTLAGQPVAKSSGYEFAGKQYGTQIPVNGVAKDIIKPGLENVFENTTGTTQGTLKMSSIVKNVETATAATKNGYVSGSSSTKKSSGSYATVKTVTANNSSNVWKTAGAVSIDNYNINTGTMEQAIKNAQTGTSNVIEQTVNLSNAKTETSLCHKTPTWGELFKKTFKNFTNYFSKLFTKEVVDNKN